MPRELRVHGFGMQDRPVMTALIERGADSCARTDDGATPLHISAAKGDIVACRLLLHHGAGGKRQASSSAGTTSSLRRDGEGKTALIVASIHGHAEVVRFLLEEGGAQIQDTDYRQARDFERGKFSSTGGNALHHAAEHGRLAVMKVLLEYCKTHGLLEQMVDAPTRTGRAITPLCVVVQLALVTKRNYGAHSFGCVASAFLSTRPMQASSSWFSPGCSCVDRNANVQ